mgnify:CR=1 FL=1
MWWNIPYIKQARARPFDYIRLGKGKDSAPRAHYQKSINNHPSPYSQKSSYSIYRQSSHMIDLSPYYINLRFWIISVFWYINASLFISILSDLSSIHNYLHFFNYTRITIHLHIRQTLHIQFISVNLGYSIHLHITHLLYTLHISHCIWFIAILWNQFMSVSQLNHIFVW